MFNQTCIFLRSSIKIIRDVTVKNYENSTYLTKTYLSKYLKSADTQFVAQLAKWPPLHL